jgi:hypothetical protein
MHIEHATFDGQPEDSFRQTSIHLSFTDYEMPVRIRDESRHIIDRPANLVETLVSVYDRRSWVADLGVIKELSGRRHKNSDVINLQRLICKSANGRDTMTDCNSDPCKSIPDLVRFLETQYGYVFYPPMTSIDNWDELLDPPTNSICVVRAQKNWLARLALTCVALRLEFVTILLPEEPCWSCCQKMLLIYINTLLGQCSDIKIALIW